VGSYWRNAMNDREAMHMKLRPFQLGLFLGLCLCGVSAAQAPIQPVKWSSALVPEASAKPGGKIAIGLSAEVQDGWHVYGLNQVSGGPIPLRLTLDDNAVAEGAGAPSGTPPVKRHDPSFNLDTELYLHSFSLCLPVQVKQHAAAGDQSVPVSVRFQACSDRTCLPPRTVHLTVPIQVLP